MPAAVAIKVALGFLVVATAIATALILGSVPAGAAHPSLHEPPGELDFYHLDPTTVWPVEDLYDRKPYNLNSPIQCADVDRDGVDEIVFSLDTGYLVVLDPEQPERSRGLDLPTSGHYYSIGVGDVDDDPSMELVLMAGDPTALYCVDVAGWYVQWRFTALGEVDDFLLFDEDRDGKQGVLVIANDSYARLDKDGGLVYDGSLFVFEHAISNEFGHVVCDHDGDGEDEVLLVDRGYRSFSLGGGHGKHLWVIDLRTGALEYSAYYPEPIFASDPVTFAWRGTTYVAVRLYSYYGNGWELFLMDLGTKQYELIDYEEEFACSWSYLMVLPTEMGPVLVVSLPTGLHMAWSVATRDVIWRTEASTPIGGLFCSFISDIDGDGRPEVVSDPLFVIDAVTGEVEVSLSRSMHVAAGDVDGDGLSEICCAEYATAEDGKRYQRVVILDSPSYVDYMLTYDGGPLTLYAGIEGELTVKVEGMMESRTPDAMRLEVSNAAQGPLLLARIDICNRTVEPVDGELLSLVEGFVIPSVSGPSLRLRLLASWWFSHEGWNDIHLFFDDWRGRTHDSVAPGALRVERDLVPVGELRIRTEAGPLAPDKWVKGDSEVIIDGFDVFYEGMPAVRPDRSAFTVVVQMGDASLERSFAGDESLTVIVNSGMRGGRVPVSIRVNQTLAGIISDAALHGTVSVDYWPPLVIEPAELQRWYSSAPIPVTVRFDEPESGMDHTGLRYTVVKHRGEEPTRWFALYEDEFGRVDRSMGGHGTHWASLRLYPPDGLSYLLVEATDAVGNSRRHWLIVRVDQTPPKVSVEAPSGWCTTDRVKVTARFEDIDGSGIDPDSVQVAFAHNDPPLFANWVPANVSGRGERVNATAFIPSVQGKLNYAKFRARDNMNHVVYSDHVTVWVDSIFPTVTLVSPLDGAVLDPPWSDLGWSMTVREDGSGIDSIEASLMELGTGKELEGAVTVEETSKGVLEVTVGWTPTTGTGCRLSMKVSDRAGNILAGVSWTTFLNSPPTVEIKSPGDNCLIASGTKVLFEADIWDRQTRDPYLSCEWSLDGRPWVRGVSTFENASLPIGTHRVRLEVSDGFYRVGANITITVYEDAGPPEEVVEEEVPEEPEAPARTSDAVVMAVCLAAIVGLFALRRHKRF